MSAESFYILKGIVGVIGVLGLVIHMNRFWKTFDEPGGISQRLRYITLFYFAVLISSASYDQVRSGVDTIEWKNVAAFGGAVLLVLSALTSFIEARNRRKRSH